MFFIPFLQTGTGTAGSASTTVGMFGTLVPFLLIFVIFYFFMIRPQNKKQKETEAMLNALKKGDKIITIGGIHGTISSVHEKTVIVKVDDNTKIEFNRSAISSVELTDAEKAKLAEANASKKSLKEKAKKSSSEEEEKITADSSENKE